MKGSVRYLFDEKIYTRKYKRNGTSINRTIHSETGMQGY